MDNLKAICADCKRVKDEKDKLDGIKARQAKLRLPKEQHPGAL